MRGPLFSIFYRTELEVLVFIGCFNYQIILLCPCLEDPLLFASQYPAESEPAALCLCFRRGVFGLPDAPNGAVGYAAKIVLAFVPDEPCFVVLVEFPSLKRTDCYADPAFYTYELVNNNPLEFFQILSLYQSSNPITWLSPYGISPG